MERNGYNGETVPAVAVENATKTRAEHRRTGSQVVRRFLFQVKRLEPDCAMIMESSSADG